MLLKGLVYFSEVGITYGMLCYGLQSFAGYGVDFHEWLIFSKITCFSHLKCCVMLYMYCEHVIKV